MTAPFHPLLLCLMRELCEADEAFRVSTGQQWSEANQWVQGVGNTFSREQMDRAVTYGAACREMALYLTIFPVEGIDSEAYKQAAQMGAVARQRLAQDIARQAIELYRGMK